jgi:hypothetical protein
MDVRCALRAVLLLLVFICIARAETDRAAPRISQEAGKILRWLPPDTETVIVVQEPFDIADESPEWSLGRSLRRMPVTVALEAHGGFLQQELRQCRILLAVHGSRRFSRPIELGMSPYEGCTILRFDESSKKVLQDSFRSCLKLALTRLRIGDKDVACFKEDWVKAGWSVFIAHPEPNLLLCATDASYLEETLLRMEHPSEPRALPADLPEWRQVDTSASIWAVRHFRPEHASKDISSPLCGLRHSWAGVPDAKAVGLVFWCNADKTSVATVRYLSSASNATEIVTKVWAGTGTEEGPKISITRPAQGVVQIAAKFENANAVGMFFLLLTRSLGHIVVV